MPSGSLVGSGQPKHDPSRKSHPDQTTFQDMFEVEQLVALNTWSKSGEQATTFLHAKAGGTQIDFALCRLADADNIAKRTRTCVIPPMPPTGMRHKLVMGSISCQAPSVHQQRPPNRVKQVRHVLDMQPEMQAPASQGPCTSPEESSPWNTRPTPSCKYGG